MKKTISQTLKPLLTDRPVLLLLIGLLITSIAYSIYVGISLQPTDLQVAVHYTSFGETEFYRNKWFYLLTFVALGPLVAVVHTAIIARLYHAERRQLALAFGWLSIFFIIMAWIVVRSVLGIAFL